MKIKEKNNDSEIDIQGKNGSTILLEDNII